MLRCSAVLFVFTCLYHIRQEICQLQKMHHCRNHWQNDWTSELAAERTHEWTPKQGPTEWASFSLCRFGASVKQLSALLSYLWASSSLSIAKLRSYFFFAPLLWSLLTPSELLLWSSSSLSYFSEPNCYFSEPRCLWVTTSSVSQANDWSKCSFKQNETINWMSES